MTHTDSNQDLIKEIPSPLTRLWVGLCIILSIFIFFAYYAARQIRWLEDFQVNVVQRNRKASLQLLRLQNDVYELGISLRDMSQARPAYPIQDWRPEFTRLRGDMENALALEREFALATALTDDKYSELRYDLQQFWQESDQVFSEARAGHERQARGMVQTEMEGRRAVISEIIARLLVLNDQAQAAANQRIDQVYTNFKRENLIVLAFLLLIAVGTGLYTLQATRTIYKKLRLLAAKLQLQSVQLRKLSWKLIDVQEETLRQVAHDLHDEFGQILTAVGIMLSRIGQKAKAVDPGLLQDAQTVKNLVEETLQSVRDRSQMLRPAILDDFGLLKTLSWFVTQFSKQTGIDARLDTALSDVTFPRDQSIHIYRIVQEALGNVARHSKASQARVIIKKDGENLQIWIRDNGSGFDVEAKMNRPAGEGFGLMGMQERAQRLDGALRIESIPGRGTEVIVQIPLPKNILAPAGKELS
jgi:signal transduction histidine kinase